MRNCTDKAEANAFMDRRPKAAVDVRVLLVRAALTAAVCLPGLTTAQDGGDSVPILCEIAPLSIRGVNYYPADTPWGGFWTETPDGVIEKDMALAASLEINTIRTFLHTRAYIRDAGFIDDKGDVSTAYLRRVDHLLEAAWAHGIRIIFCFEFKQTLTARAADGSLFWRKIMRQFLERYRNDGRVLMWDLMNEPEGQNWEEQVCVYLREAMPFAKSIDPNHPTTVGIAYQVARLAELGLPDVLQYHEYAPKAELFSQGTDRVAKPIATQRKVGGSRPVLIGEFGMSTARDPLHGAPVEWRDRLPMPPGTEADQHRLYQIVLRAAEEQRIAGVMPWCLHSYRTREKGFLTPTESMFGLVRRDGTLKPAAMLLRQTYGEWKRRPRAISAPPPVGSAVPDAEERRAPQRDAGGN